MKKVLALVLAAMMLLSMVPALAEQQETITLNFVESYNSNRAYLADVMAAEYMRRNPNVKINVIKVPGDYNTGLQDLISAGTQIDFAASFTAAELNTSNKIMLDITDLAKNDPDYAKLFPGMAKGGQYSTDRIFAIPGSTNDTLLFFDQTQFERLNLELPGRDWTLEDMEELFTIASDPENGYFSLTGSLWAAEMFEASYNPNAVATWGWDGENIDMTYVAECYNYNVELIDDGHNTWNGTALYAQFVPDNAWIGHSGRIATYMHWFDNWPTMLNPDFTASFGVRYIPYYMPVVEGGGQRSSGNYYFVGANTQYPQEAYDALKFMVWGLDGWLWRLENNVYARTCIDANFNGYASDVLFNDAKAANKADGTAMENYAFGAYAFGCPLELPAVNDPALNEALAKTFPEQSYWGTYEDYLALFNSRVNPVPTAEQVALGFSTFNNNVLYNTDYNGTTHYVGAIHAHLIDPLDYVEAQNAAFAQIHEEAMKVFKTTYGIED